MREGKKRMERMCDTPAVRRSLFSYACARFVKNPSDEKIYSPSGKGFWTDFGVHTVRILGHMMVQKGPGSCGALLGPISGPDPHGADPKSVQKHVPEGLYTISPEGLLTNLALCLCVRIRPPQDVCESRRRIVTLFGFQRRQDNFTHAAGGAVLHQHFPSVRQ